MRETRRRGRAPFIHNFTNIVEFTTPKQAQKHKKLKLSTESRRDVQQKEWIQKNVSAAVQAAGDSLKYVFFLLWFLNRFCSYHIEKQNPTQLNNYIPTSKIRARVCHLCRGLMCAACTHSIHPCAAPLWEFISSTVLSFSKVLVFLHSLGIPARCREQHKSLFFLNPRPCVSTKAKTNIHLLSKPRSTLVNHRRNVLGGGGETVYQRKKRKKNVVKG